MLVGEPDLDSDEVSKGKRYYTCAIGTIRWKFVTSKNVLYVYFHLCSFSNCKF
jgi:hypothetical protein